MGTLILPPSLHTNRVPSRLDLLEIENVIRILFQWTIRMRNHSLEVLRRPLPCHLGLLFLVRAEKEGVHVHMLRELRQQFIPQPSEYIDHPSRNIRTVEYLRKCDRTKRL